MRIDFRGAGLILLRTELSGIMIAPVPVAFRLQPNCPCDNLNNCPGLQEGIREVLCPNGLASTLLA